MRRFPVVAVIRHNTSLGGDLKLAIREMEALAGSPAQALDAASDFEAALAGLGIAALPELRSGDGAVALRWNALGTDAINRLLRCSAFLQELFVLSVTQEAHDAFAAEAYAPCLRVGELDGVATVALAWGYIIESEGVLDSARLTGRVRETVDLLFEPFQVRRPSPHSRRVRKAKKTTLSLSHDLHIYKAKFFPRMVRAVMNIFGSENARIVDPFCGSGTALLEAALLGYDSVGVDVDPICQMIARTKVTPFLRAEDTLSALDAFDSALEQLRTEDADFAFPDELAKKIARRDRLDDTSYLAEITRDAARLAGAMQHLAKSGFDTDLLRVIASDAVTKKVRYRFVGVGNGRYTIEIVKQSLLARVREKALRARQLCYVFKELRDDFSLRIGQVEVHDGDARHIESWGLKQPADIIITSPPYLPASSGREHYTASRALSFAVLGLEHGKLGYYNVNGDGIRSDFIVSDFEEANQLMDYLMSDASATADPQRDAMRFERKAMPTRQYLADMSVFFDAAHEALAPDGFLLLVVANQHTFYSHRRQQLEHIVSGPALYSQLAAPSGFALDEVITMELLKSAVSKARPRATEDYFEAILVARRRDKNLALRETSEFGNATARIDAF